MGRALSYAVMLVICGTLTIWGATYVANSISASFNHTADLISHPH